MAHQQERTADKFRRLSKFWEKRAIRSRRAIEEALLAYYANDLEGIERILTNALSKAEETANTNKPRA